MFDNHQSWKQTESASRYRSTRDPWLDFVLFSFPSCWLIGPFEQGMYFFSHKCVCVSLYMFVNLHLCNVHFSAFWFSSLAGPLPGNISGFSASVALTLFFSLNLPECDTLTWRPLLAVVLSTIFPSRASSWASSVWAAAPEAALERCWLLGELDTNSGEISYKTFGWDFFLLIKVSFHQPVDDSAMMNKMWGGINLKRRKKIN